QFGMLLFWKIAKSVLQRQFLFLCRQNFLALWCVINGRLIFLFSRDGGWYSLRNILNEIVLCHEILICAKIRILRRKGPLIVYNQRPFLNYTALKFSGFQL